MAALAGGYEEAAAAQLAGAAAAYRALGLGWDAARALLVLGRAQRRAKKRAAARQSLEAAWAGFEQLGCPGWARMAAAELDRISGRRAAPAGGLTPAERRIAELAASGLSNKEIAARLYLSASTVEVQLSRVYAKLGVRSRAQLARRLGAPRPSAVARPANWSKLQGFPDSRARPRAYGGPHARVPGRGLRPARHADTAARRAGQAALAAGQVSQPWAPVRLLGAILVPEEETCFYLYQAPVGRRGPPGDDPRRPAARPDHPRRLDPAAESRPWHREPDRPLRRHLTRREPHAARNASARGSGDAGPAAGPAANHHRRQMPHARLDTIAAEAAGRPRRAVPGAVRVRAAAIRRPDRRPDRCRHQVRRAAVRPARLHRAHGTRVR